jgi:hypothetical protein
VDQDRDHKRERLRQLTGAREEERQRKPPFPTALGEANPHAEAWLLDDPAGVRAILQIAASTSVPTVRKAKNPKEALETHWKQSSRAQDRAVEVWEAIARAVDPSRYLHADKTGFRQFADDVKRELGPITGNRTLE